MIARILVLQEIDRERSRQELLKAQGKFRHTAADAIPPDRAFAILTEEVGEVARELNDAAAAGRPAGGRRAPCLGLIPDRDRMFCVLWPLVSSAVWLLLLALFLFGCAASRNRLVAYADADVLYTTAAEVNRLCHLAPGAPAAETYRACYIPALRLAIVAHGDADALAHELRHAREGNFHP